jgi:hypothetical protein
MLSFFLLYPMKDTYGWAEAFIGFSHLWEHCRGLIIFTCLADSGGGGCKMERKNDMEDLTEKEMEVLMTVFRSFETGLREATIYPKVIAVYEIPKRSKNEYQINHTLFKMDYYTSIVHAGPSFCNENVGTESHGAGDC